MRDFYIALGLLLAGFIALQVKATRNPFDYRVELLADSRNSESLSNALTQVMKAKSEKQHPVSIPR